MIAIVIPTYNCADTILHSLNSILRQSYRNIVVHVINDGSTDATEQILNGVKDTRVHIHNLKHVGIVKALNHGLTLSDIPKVEYIARMDADDVSANTRIEKQRKYMIDNDLGLSGTWTHILDNGVNVEKFHPRVKINDMKKWMLKMNLFIHGSVMFKREILDTVGYYDINLSEYRVQDFDYWLRIMNKYKVGILDDYLYSLYRRKGSDSDEHGNAIYNAAKELRERWSKKWVISIPEKDLPEYNTIS